MRWLVDMQMNGWLVALWCGMILQRLWELRKARKNAAWSRAQGGYEVGEGHYPLIVMIHVFFLSGILVESIAGATPPIWWMVPFSLFLLAQGLRVWCMQALGTYWNTRIWVIPGHTPQIGGPYRFIRHPNYVVVMLEMLSFPLVFGAYMTAIIAPVLNLIVLLAIRIPTEERALRIVMGYEETMGKKGRFVPK